MRICRDHEALTRLALPTPETELHTLVAKGLNELNECECSDLSFLMHLVILEEGDTLETLETELGFTAVRNRWTGLGPDAAGFTPSWDVLEEHTHWFELVFVLSDDGFGVVVFVSQKHSSALTDICNRYA